MSCSNCYNGCTEIVSDRCVKYTGIDIPILEIKTGDSLSYVEQALIQFLVSTLNGSGIKITLPQTAYCEVVTKYLPTCGDVTALTLFEALVKAACDLQEQIDTINSTLTTLNADYTIGCLTGVTASSDTHAIVQAIITKLCQIDVSLTALSINVNTNYVKIADINTYIANYINSTAPSSKYYNKMVPYTAVEYYGPLTGNFDGTGAGIAAGPWEKIYLCNGQNGTPDKRGVVPVGVTDGTMGGGTMNAKVNPATPGGFNPTYTLGGVIQGNNSVTLTIGQIPAHTHPGSSSNTVISPNPHTHVITPNNPGFVSTIFDPTPTGPGAFITEVNAGGPLLADDVELTANTTITIAEQGQNLPHANNQPALACYYIMYRP